MESDGKVHKKVFEKILQETRTFVSKEELAFMFKKSQDPLNEQFIDYNRLAIDLGLYSDLTSTASF